MIDHRTPKPETRKPLWRSALIGAVIGALLACATEVGRMLFDRNKHDVVPGRVYRTAQLNPQQLERFVHEKNIRTVINLRGRPFNEWYPAQSQTTQALGISQEDVTTSANRLPPPGEIRRLIEIFDHSEHPLLIHCQQGADRTGLASAIYLMLYTDADYPTALRQCSPRYGHFRIHTTAAMDEFFDQYQEWLTETDATHGPEPFRRWATTAYTAGPGKAKLELVNAPTRTDPREPHAFTLKATNTSRESWHFKAGSGAGIHVTYAVHEIGGDVVFKGKAGFLDALVPPGEAIELQLPIPALPKSARYALWVDLTQRNVSFTQYGSEPLTYDWEARNPTPLRGS